jgi:CP family cyanate transporter-like MFS transporter
MSKKEQVLIILGIIFISFNLRAPITAIGSVVELIQAKYALSSVAAGFITTLPLLAFAIVSPFVAKISQKIGSGKSMVLGLLFIIMGELIRSYTNSFGLFAGTALLGVGIAIGNVLIPSIIKTKFPHKLGMMTGIYTSSMCVFAAVGAGTSMPMAKGFGWENSLAFWIILAVVTLLIWMPQLKQQHKIAPTTQNSNQEKTDSIWKSATAWWVTLFMGVQSLLFYSLVAWLPTIIISKGMTDSFSGSMALAFQLIAIPATLVIPLLCDKVKNQRGLVMFTCLLYLMGMIFFLFAQDQATIFFAVTLMSLGMGGSISLSIAFISLRSPNAKRTSELSGMTQSAGYLLAAVGPILMGLIFDNLQSWTVTIIIFCALIVSLAFFGYFAGANVLTERREPTAKDKNYFSYAFFIKSIVSVFKLLNVFAYNKRGKSNTTC